MTGTYIPRELWSTVMNALPHPDPAIRDAAYTRMLAAAPTAWDSDLADPDEIGFAPQAQLTIPPRTGQEPQQ